MKIIFEYQDGSKKTSPSFVAPPEYVIEEFWDEFLGGGDDECDEVFWDADVHGTDDEITVSWFEDPIDPQKMVDNLGLGLKSSIPPFNLWT